MKIVTSFKALREAGFEEEKIKRLEQVIGEAEKYGEEKPITISQILDANGLHDAIWALRTCPEAGKLCRTLALDFAEHVLQGTFKNHPDGTKIRNIFESIKNRSTAVSIEDTIAIASNIITSTENVSNLITDMMVGLVHKTPAEAAYTAYIHASAYAEYAGRLCSKEPWQSMFKENDWQEKHFRKLLKQTEGDGNVA